LDFRLTNEERNVSEEKTVAGKVELIMKLLGGEEEIDDDGNVYITPEIIDVETAKKLLGFKEDENE
jgi:hypothetical protein